MSHNTLIEKIENDTKTVISEIESQQAADVAVIDGETKALVAERKTEHDKALEKTLQHMELVASSQSRQNANIALQSAKRAQIDEVFSAALENIKSQSSDGYVTFFAKLAKEIVSGKSEVTTVFSAPERESETAKILSEMGIDAKVTVDKNISAGLIVHTEDGVYDVTLSRLFSEKRPELEMEVVKSLVS